MADASEIGGLRGLFIGFMGAEVTPALWAPTEKEHNILDMGGFWLGDNCRIIEAVS